MAIKKSHNLFLTFFKFIYSLTHAGNEKVSGNNVKEWSLRPDKPQTGDVLIIEGKAEPNSIMDIAVSFSVAVPVSQGRYEYVFNEIQIPKGRNSFNVRSRRVKDLNFIVRMFVDFKRSFEAEEGTATFSEENVPAGKYDIVINGEAEDREKQVMVDFTATESISSDSDGEFHHKYVTNALPAGKFIVRIGDIEKEVNLKQVS